MTPASEPDLRAPSPKEASTARTSALRRWRVRAAISLFLVVFGGRLWLVDRAGSDLPHWDEWFANFGTIVLPLSEGTLGLTGLAVRHNEHHLFFQRLSTLTLMTASGRWEPREGVVLSAFVRAAGLAVVFFLLSLNQPGFIRMAALLLLAVLGAMPVGVFNLLSGFQMQFFLVEPLAVATLAALFLGSLTVERLALAFGLLLLALLNMATAVITALGAALVLGLRVALRRGEASRNLAAVASLALFCAFVLLTTPRPSDIYSESVFGFVRILAKVAAWPFPETPVLGLIAAVPPLLLLRRLIKDPEMPWSAWFVFALSVAGWIQNAAIALARGKTALVSSFPQYVDGFWLGHIVGLLALAEALRPRSPEGAALQRKVCGFWILWLVAGLTSDVVLRGGPGLESVRQATALRQPAFAAALQSGGSPMFDTEMATVYQMWMSRDNSIFDHPAGRFATPPVVHDLLKNDWEKFAPYLPAALVGAKPSLVFRSMRTLTRFSPLLLGLGVLMMAASLRALRTVSPRP